DGIDAHVRRELPRERFREADYAGLGRAVRRAMQGARDAAVAAHVEDRAALRDEVGFERLGQEGWRGEVDRDRSVPALTRQLFERELLADARIVDEQAHLTLLARSIDHRVH